MEKTNNEDYQTPERPPKQDKNQAESEPQDEIPQSPTKPKKPMKSLTSDPESEVAIQNLYQQSSLLQSEYDLLTIKIETL